MTENSPENLRKFLENDDPAMVRMGISMAKGTGVEVTIKDLESFLNKSFEPLQTLSYYDKLSDTKQITTGFIIADEAGIGDEAIEMLCNMLWQTCPRECVPITNDGERSAADESLARAVVKVLDDIGDLRTVEPLIKVLQYHEATDPESNSSHAYGIPPKKVRKGAADALDKLKWKPETEGQRASYLIAKEDWNALVELGEASVKPLVEAMKWDNGDLIGYLGGGDNSGEGIEETLKRIGDSAVEVLSVALTDEYHKVRKSATQILGKIGDARAVGPLTEVVLEDLVVRNYAIRALGEIGDVRAVESLVKLLKGGYAWNLYLEGERCNGTVWALEKVGWKPETDELRVTFLLAKGHANGDLAGCSKLGERAVAPLIKLLRDDLWAPYRTSVIRILGEIGDERAVEPLIGMLSDSRQGISMGAIDALGGIGGVRVVELLIGMLSGTNNYCIKFPIYRRWHAARALGNIGDERAVEPLIKLLEDDYTPEWGSPHHTPRFAAAKGLGSACSQ
jgi:HEAT repeat protein